jgi:hypothetical protein
MEKKQKIKENFNTVSTRGTKASRSRTAYLQEDAKPAALAKKDKEKPAKELPTNDDEEAKAGPI